MSSQLQSNARQILKENLARCTIVQQIMFKQRYASSIGLSINIVVDQMPEEELDWTIQQVEQTLIKNEKKD